MKKEEILELYLRDTSKLHDEVSAYVSDEQLWEIRGSIINSGGNLCLHLLGNLNHFIGATLGHTGYVRNRDAEFNSRHVSRTGLLTELREAQEMLKTVFATLTDSDLQKEYPFDFAGKHNIAYYLLFFAMHLNYHLGQINYHRRGITT